MRRARHAELSVLRSKLVFGRMLGLNVTYTAKATHAEMYLSLRSGDCDVAITAIEMCVYSQ